jgi:hypothetical protein
MKRYEILLMMYEVTKYGCDMRALAIAQTEEWLATPEGLAWMKENG